MKRKCWGKHVYIYLMNENLMMILRILERERREILFEFSNFPNSFLFKSEDNAKFRNFE